MTKGVPWVPPYGVLVSRLDTESEMMHWEWQSRDSAANVMHHATYPYIDAMSADGTISPPACPKGGKMPNFKVGDVVEYKKHKFSIPQRIGSIAIVTAAPDAYQGISVRWIFPTWDSDEQGEQDHNISSLVFKRLTRAKL